MAGSSDAAPRVGDVFVLPESEYLYGVGPIIVRVTRVHGQVDYRGEPWWHVSGNAANGTPANHGGPVARDLYLRHKSMKQTRQIPPT